MLSAERRSTSRIAIVDGGGRGHALADAYAKDPHIRLINLLPGNDFAKKDIQDRYGIKVSTDKSVNLKDPSSIRYAIAHGGGVNFVDVAQDDALAGDAAGWSRKNGFSDRTFGPDANGAQIESNKVFARNLGSDAGFPQPLYETFSNPAEAHQYLSEAPQGAYFVKASGLAEGKGALPADSLEVAHERVDELIERFPQAAREFVIEQWLRNADGTNGDEFSHFVITDGKNYKDLGVAVDYKRANNFDLGENTGSMGSNSPTNLVDEDLLEQSRKRIVEPLLDQLQRRGIDYRGVIYVSGIATQNQNGERELGLIELNSRLGDPEVQAIVPGIKNYYEIAQAVASGDISGVSIAHDGKHRVVVTGASRGYPRSYSEVKEKEIYGIDEAQQVEGVRVFGAGITYKDKRPTVSGGRVLYVVGEGDSIHTARERAYAGMSHINIEGNNLHLRTDIGYRDVLRARSSKTA